MLQAGSLCLQNALPYISPSKRQCLQDLSLALTLQQLVTLSSVQAMKAAHAWKQPLPLYKRLLRIGYMLIYARICCNLRSAWPSL